MTKNYHSATITDGGTNSTSVDTRGGSIVALRASQSVTVKIQSAKTENGSFYDMPAALQGLALTTAWVTLSPQDTVGTYHARFVASGAVSGDTTIEVVTLDA